MEKGHKVTMSVLLLSTLCLTMLMMACEEEAKIQSSWRDREVRVDGKDHEWQGSPQYYDEDTRSVISILNDENHVFILLSANKPEIQKQILIQGLTLWLEKDGEKKRKIGVHFPVGIPREKRMSISRGAAEEVSGTFGEFPKGAQGSIREFPKMEQGEIQLLGPREYEQKTMPLAEISKYGIEVKINETKRHLVYELKMPITKTEENHHAFLHPGKESFRIGFQTGEAEEKEARLIGRQTPNGADSSEGARGKPGGIGGGPSGGKGKRSEGGKVEPFEIWLAVTLAEKSQKTNQENR